MFCEEYVKDFNQTRAAIRAGFSPRSAYNQGSRLMKKDEVAKKVGELISERQMGPDEVKLRLADMGRGDMGDFLDVSSMAWQLDLPTAKEHNLTKLIKKLRQKTVTTISKDGTETETNTQEIELYDAKDALKSLGNHHKLFTEKHEVDLSLNIEGLEELLDKIYGNPKTQG